MVCPLHLYIYLLLFTEWYVHYTFIFTFSYSLNGLSITPLYLPSFIHWMVCPLQLYIYLLFTEWYVHYTFIFTFFYLLNGLTITSLYLPSTIHWMVCPLHLYIYLLLFTEWFVHYTFIFTFFYWQLLTNIFYFFRAMNFFHDKNEGIVFLQNNKLNKNMFSDNTV